MSDGRCIICRVDPCYCNTIVENTYDSTHPLADKLKPPTWDEPGECICGLPLPPEKEWDRAGQDWANVLCVACGRGYVNEEDFFAIYDPADVERNGGANDWKVRVNG